MAVGVRADRERLLEAARRCGPVPGAIEGVILRYGMFYGLDTPSAVAMIDRRLTTAH